LYRNEIRNKKDLQSGLNHLVMKPEISKTDQKNWALPGEPLSLEEFKKGIKEAEKGPFYTVEESKRMIARWREKRISR
jgi:hypothetical protein